MDYEILFRDDNFIAINKPYGHLVHPSPIAIDAAEIVLRNLRDQIGQFVYPVHRLDRKTCGVLVFGLHSDAARFLSPLFPTDRIHKVYHALLRGWVLDEGRVEYDLTNDKGKTQNAITDYKPIAHYEIDIPLGHFSTSRYTLCALVPHTGRMHQLRKHMNHLRHPIIGDRPHGCSKQNRMWKSKFAFTEMMLHAREITIPLMDDSVITIKADYSPEFKRVMDIITPYALKP